MFEDEKTQFQYQDSDFTPEGKINFKPLPEKKARYDKQGNLINKGEADNYYQVRDKNKLLKECTKFDTYGNLWENFDRLSPNQQKALQLLISGHNIRDTARKCETSEATLYRWLQLDIFNYTLKAWQKRLFIEADLKINSVIHKALNQLEFVLDNPTKFDSRDYLKAIELSLNFLNREK